MVPMRTGGSPPVAMAPWDQPTQGGFPWKSLWDHLFPYHENLANYTNCVAACEVLASPLFRETEEMRRAKWMLDMSSFMGGRATHAESCVSIHMSYVVAFAPPRGTHCGTCPLACVSHHHRPQQGVPTCLSARGEQSRKTARILHNIT